MQRIFPFVQKITQKRYSAEIIASLGVFVYFVFSVFFAFTQRPILDEGLYTYKGWLFVRGLYTPYQDYGPWMNHMPLSFLIPGVVQFLFGPGLRTGRYFAIFLSLLMLVGLYLTSRRLAGKWLASAVVWAFSLNFYTIQTYSIAISQGLVACILVWILFLSLGADRALWQILLAVFLSAVLLLVRINMSPLLILLVLYLWWEHGWEKARWITLVAIASFAGLHYLFWPGILQNWQKWTPSILGIFSFSQSTVIETNQEPTQWTQIPFPYSHLNSLFLTIRYHFFSVIGVMATWLLWPLRISWKSYSEYRAAVFLSVSFGVMFLAHAWATLGNTYCVLCLPYYTAFYQTIGILLVVLCWKYWKRKVPFLNQILIVLFILIVSIGIAFSLNEILNIVSFDLVENVFILFHKGELTNSLAGKIMHPLFDTFYFQSEKDVIRFAKQVTSSIYGFYFAVCFLFLVGLWWYKKRMQILKRSFGNYALNFFLLIGFLLLPTKYLSNVNSFQCSENQIANFEKLGGELAQKVPDGSQVYWLGYSPSLLLYLPDVGIFPAQLNHYNNFVNSIDTNQLYRVGQWNRELAEIWVKDATYLIITQLVYKSETWLIEDYVKTGIYQEVPLSTSSFYTCDDTGQLKIRLFEKRKE